MSVVSQTAISQLTVIGTEHTVATINVAGVFTLILDLNPMAAGDVLEVRAKQMVATGGTTRGVDLATYYDAQPSDRLIAVSVPVSNPLGDTGAVQFSIKQTAGSVRTFLGRVDRIG